MRKILLIEDFRSDAQRVEHSLRDAGVQNPFQILASGAEAINFFEETDRASSAPPPLVPSVILIKLQLPDMSGLDVLSRIHRKPSFTETLRVVLSTLDELEPIKRAYAVGAHTFLAKPIREEDVDEMLAFFPQFWSLAPTARVLKKPPHQGFQKPGR